MRSFENWGIFSDIPQFQMGNIRPRDSFRPIARERKYLIDYNFQYFGRHGLPSSGCCHVVYCLYLETRFELKKEDQVVARQTYHVMCDTCLFKCFAHFSSFARVFYLLFVVSRTTKDKIP